MSDATTTTNHRVIRAWVEARGGRPCRGTADTGPALRIAFDPAEEPEDLHDEIPWVAFFAVFEGKKLAFRHRDLTEDGAVSREHDFVPREGD